MKTKRTTSGGNNFQFAQIVKGEFHVKVDSETPGAVMRKNKNGVEVFELIYNEIEGVYLHEFEVTESEFGKQLKIYLRDEDAKEKFFVIQVPLNSMYAYSFLNRSNQVELTKPVTVKVFEIDNMGKDGKPYKTKTITIAQDGKSVDKSWTPENNLVPKPTELLDKKGKAIIKNGFAQFDYTDKETFLETFVNETMVPKMKEVIKDVMSNKPEGELESADVVEVSTDDLPF